MDLGNLDSRRHAAVSRDQQELAARCGFEERSLPLRETERLLHTDRFGGAMAAEQHC